MLAAGKVLLFLLFLSSGFSAANSLKHQEQKVFDEVMRFMASDKHELALTKLDALLKKHPHSAPLQLLKSKLLLSLGRHIQAKELLQSLPEELRALDDFKFAWLRVHYELLSKNGTDKDLKNEFHASFNQMLDETHLFVSMRKQYLGMLTKFPKASLQKKFCHLEKTVEKSLKQSPFCSGEAKRGEK